MMVRRRDIDPTCTVTSGTFFGDRLVSRFGMRYRSDLQTHQQNVLTTPTIANQSAVCNPPASPPEGPFSLTKSCFFSIKGAFLRVTSHWTRMSRNRGPEHRAMRIWKMGRSGAQSPILPVAERYDHHGKGGMRSLADQVAKEGYMEIDLRGADTR
jgi:hypothetical protein